MWEVDSGVEKRCFFLFHTPRKQEWKEAAEYRNVMLPPAGGAEDSKDSATVYSSCQEHPSVQNLKDENGASLQQRIPILTSSSRNPFRNDPCLASHTFLFFPWVVAVVANFIFFTKWWDSESGTLYYNNLYCWSMECQAYFWKKKYNLPPPQKNNNNNRKSSRHFPAHSIGSVSLTIREGFIVIIILVLFILLLLVISRWGVGIPTVIGLSLHGC